MHGYSAVISPPTKGSVVEGSSGVRKHSRGRVAFGGTREFRWHCSCQRRRAARCGGRRPSLAAASKGGAIERRATIVRDATGAESAAGRIGDAQYHRPVRLRLHEDTGVLNEGDDRVREYI